MINISDRDIVSSNRFSTLTNKKSDKTNKHVEDHVITIPDQDTASSNQFSAFTNNNDEISFTKIRENSDKFSLKQSNDSIPKQLITTLNVRSKKNMVTNSKRQKNISSNSINSKNKNVSVIIGDFIIKDIKGWELSNESEKFVAKFFGGATKNDMESYIQPTIERVPSNVILQSGTNDLKTSTDTEQIAKSRKTDKNNVIISELTPRNDQLNKKAKEVNKVLTRECNKRNIGVIKHDNMNARRHCNMSDLHLNWKGTNILIEKILFYLNKFCSN